MTHLVSGILFRKKLLPNITFLLWFLNVQFSERNTSVLIIDSSKTTKATTTSTTTRTTKVTDIFPKSGIPAHPRSGVPSMWHLPKQQNNCWSRCKGRGGKCEWCGLNGYCCSGTKLHANGDCPLDGVTYIGTQTSRGIHLCVANLNGE